MKGEGRGGREGGGKRGRKVVEGSVCQRIEYFNFKGMGGGQNGMGVVWVVGG